MTDGPPENRKNKTPGSATASAEPRLFYTFRLFFNPTIADFISLQKEMLSNLGAQTPDRASIGAHREHYFFGLFFSLPPTGRGMGPPADLLPPSSHTVGSLFPYCSPLRFQRRHAHHYGCQSRRRGRRRGGEKEKKKKSSAQMTNSSRLVPGGNAKCKRNVCRRLEFGAAVARVGTPLHPGGPPWAPSLDGGPS